MSNAALAQIVNERVVRQGIVPKKIKRLEFGIFSAEEMRRIAHMPVVNPELYQLPSRKPVPFGVLDPQLGTSTKKQLCETCGLDIKECVGHFGYIKLELPVFHIGYIKNIVETLQQICKKCSKVLLDNGQRSDFLTKLRKPKLEILIRKSISKSVLDTCKKVFKCPHCGAVNGPVKKLSHIKILHDVFKAKGKDDVDELTEDFNKKMELAISYNEEIKNFVQKAGDDINPLRCLDLFSKISDEDVELLNMDPELNRPENMVMTHMIVPPVCIRPSVPTDHGSNEDDLTIGLTRIIHQNEFIKHTIQKGSAGMESLMEVWDNLQLLCAYYINSELPGFPQNVAPAGKAGRSLCQRLKGKHGRFRGNLSGKRVDFSGRTVISPDPNVRIDNVVVPLLVAKVLTYPERVNDINIQKLQQMVINGPDIYPGANFVESADGSDKRHLKFGNRMMIARNLQIGDVVERHLIDEDIVLFNRQPSLHRLSIMCHKVKVLPYRTFRFNENCCAPYNADFDGDEMNLHVPQTEEARAEAGILMNILNNLITPRNGEPLVASNQDFLTGSFLLTRKNVFFDRSEFCMLCAYLEIPEKIDLPPPAILKPIELWTGKQIFGLLVRPNEKVDIFLNLEAKGRNYTGKEHFDNAESYIHFRNSELISGCLDKKILGDGSKYTMHYQLIKHYGPEYATKCMSRVAKLTARWLMNYGFSIGINDVQPSEILTSKKKALLQKGYAVCDDYIKKFNTGQLEQHPGCNAEQTLEAILNKELSQIRQDAGNMCVGELHYLNAPLIMSQCGSKGSIINISQMIACVGQQTVSGSRIQNGFFTRTLPHFYEHSRTPAAKGFVENSFYTGLSPTEFFFHTMAGREGLVDTAVKTAETGYMQRRLMKALEDLTVHYDHTVRNSASIIVQFKYGDDGLDSHLMEAEDGRPINLKMAFMHIRNTITPKSNEPKLSAEQVRTMTKEYLDANADLYSDKFVDEVSRFLDGYAIELEDVLVSVQSTLDKSTPHTKQAWDQVLNKSNRIAASQLKGFFAFMRKKYEKMIAEPGHAVGALGGQSIGEPGTQMTLKTFHFAGVASMRVSLGVPRIVEIINATKAISTPIITAALVSERDEKTARIVKGRIEKTTLGQIAAYIQEVYDVGICYIEIALDPRIVNGLQLDIDLHHIMRAIICTPKIGLKEKFLNIVENKVRVYPPKSSREAMYHQLQHLKRMLPSVIVSGIPTVNRAVISKQEKDKTKMNLLVEGTNLQAVMGTPGVNGKLSTSNNVLEVEGTLGIEAARKTIMNEIHYTMSSYGMTIDFRHIMLLADVMSFKGEILGITRHGIAKMKDSVLMLASFERTTDHLFDAGAHARKDEIEGVSECIIMGIPISVGTGLFKVMQETKVQMKPPRKTLFSMNSAPKLLL